VIRDVGVEIIALPPAILRREGGDDLRVDAIGALRHLED
jgi:hypothetical protein